MHAGHALLRETGEYSEAGENRSPSPPSSRLCGSSGDSAWLPNGAGIPTLSARRDIIAHEVLASVQPGSKLNLPGTVEETDNDSGHAIGVGPGHLALAHQVCSKRQIECELH
jgi:hypothetical protein